MLSKFFVSVSFLLCNISNTGVNLTHAGPGAQSGGGQNLRSAASDPVITAPSLDELRTEMTRREERLGEVLNFIERHERYRELTQMELDLHQRVIFPVRDTLRDLRAKPQSPEVEREIADEEESLARSNFVLQLIRQEYEPIMTGLNEIRHLFPEAEAERDRLQTDIAEFRLQIETYQK